MKKIILLFAVSIITGSAFAQLGLDYGIKAGANFSTLTDKATGASISNTSYKAGLYAGIFGSINIGEGIGISADLAFSQMGGKADLVDNTGTKVGTIDQTLNYIPLSVFFNYGIPNVKGLGVFAGPQISFLASYKGKATIDGVGTTESTDKSGIKSTDFAGVIGVQYQLPTIPIIFSARYQYGFTNIGKDAGDKLYNSAATVTVGYAFGGKKK